MNDILEETEIGWKDIDAVRHLRQRCPYVATTMAQWRHALSTVFRSHLLDVVVYHLLNLFGIKIVA